MYKSIVIASEFLSVDTWFGSLLCGILVYLIIDTGIYFYDKWIED